MNVKKLMQAESLFLKKIPGGFSNPEMVKIGKKHKMEKMIETANEFFSKKNCKNIQVTSENMVKVISRSSMVSMFEKPKFRDFVKSLKNDDKEFLVKGLSNLLHGKKQLGFEAIVDILKTEKLAKWSLVTVIPAYYFPDDEVFVKPTTAKDVIKYFEVEDMIYKPAPTWDFYQKYRDLIHTMKSKVDSSLAPSNAAFSGFLMMSMKM
ncbi:hypothetical protein [Aliikangiella coralliicola]|uniref:Uncharacterized protein n=1 Tax=Aliikangiella coralliicola TaxID=2592383 RepID=A0A545UHX0_9GAMM|nr:hypothetical protein [Aliikangiella coralliicola]TQV89065.1 hypothetical protein FLL46_05930 [Aliikangiella coralliicola]